MKIVELLRNRAFWFVDMLTGQKKRFHYNEIKYLIENPKASKAIDIKKAHLHNIMKHATVSTNYYKKYQEKESIEDFPVIDKNIIRDNFSSFQSNSFIDKPKFALSTSGSTGTPFKIFQDKGKRIRNIADTIYFSEKAGYRLGYKLTFFRLWNAFEKKGKITRWFQNVKPVDVFDLKKEYFIDKIIRGLSKSKKSNSWLGYASAYQAICKYLDNKKSPPIQNNLKSVIAISEKLNAYTKQSIRKYFDIEVVSRYSNVENGIIAQQPLGDKEFFEINEASYFVEVLELYSNNRTEEGKLGRIVITDLFNYSMPLIRYDTGDLGIAKTIGSKTILTEVKGRKIDQIYNTKGEIISINLVLLVNNYPELKQCQLIQKGLKVYHFKLNTDQEFCRENELLNEFKVYLGEDAQFTIEYVDEIPLLASGKRRMMVNDMINS